MSIDGVILQNEPLTNVELMSMLIFNDRNGEGDQPPYVVHVSFDSISRRTADRQFTVNVTLILPTLNVF